MKKIIYWSQTGNTEKMADAIAEGVREAGKNVEILTVSEADIDELKELDAFAIGCPAMGDEVLEEEEMEPFVDAICNFANGKKIAIFGSYGWGDGQWMRDWEIRMKDAGAELITGEGLMLNEEPDSDGLSKCKEMGKALADA